LTRNPYEQQVHKDLKKRAAGRYKVSYETEQIPYVIEGTYIPDFILTFRDGAKLYIETKGRFRREDRRKFLSVVTQHPDKDIRIVFQKDSNCDGTRMKMSKWAEKYNITYAIGTIPKEWLKQ